MVYLNVFSGKPLIDFGSSDDDPAPRNIGGGGGAVEPLPKVVKTSDDFDKDRVLPQTGDYKKRNTAFSNKMRSVKTPIGSEMNRKR